MPFRWTFWEREELVHIAGTGSLDLTAAIENLFEVSSSAEFSPHWCVLADLREMVYEHTPVEAVEIARVLSTARSLLRGRVAVIPPDRAFELAKMAASIASKGGLSIRAFGDPEQARAWLFSAQPSA